VLEWLVGAVAGFLGVSPLVAVGFLVAASVGTSAALRWLRSTRQDEYYYLNLTEQMYAVQTSGIAIDPFTLQPVGDPRLSPAPPATASEGPKTGSATAPRRARYAPRVVVRRAGTRRQG
jgi:hypothetical protein